MRPAHGTSELGSAAERVPQALCAHNTPHTSAVNPTGHMKGHTLHEVFVQDAAAWIARGVQARTWQRRPKCPANVHGSAANIEHRGPLPNTKMWQQRGSTTNSPKRQFSKLSVDRAPARIHHGARLESGSVCAKIARGSGGNRRRRSVGSDSPCLPGCSRSVQADRVAMDESPGGSPFRGRLVRGPVLYPTPGPGRLPARILVSRKPVWNHSPGPAPLCAARP